MIGSHPAALHRPPDRLLPAKALPKKRSQRHRCFPSGNGRIRRGMQVRSQRIGPANGRPVNRRERRMANGQIVEPHQGHPRPRQIVLHRPRLRPSPAFHRQRRDRARRLPHVPLDRMQPERPVRQMRNADILPGRQKVHLALRQQRRHRNLERTRHRHPPAFVRAAGMDVHHIEPRADGIRVPAGARTRLRFVRDILLHHPLARR